MLKHQQMRKCDYRRLHRTKDLEIIISDFQNRIILFEAYTERKGAKSDKLTVLQRWCKEFHL